ncbi:LuxR family transcriptional regulator [Streptomyces sp. A012304]|uniref:helix-turn-helix transcriptional regulator n=1 Tax=Streptomyces sp. A012304 TaxID=375446 RepID=UPI00222F0549|nr:LuxR family transcriptional regulator [Streptomyces sp. A012304]
MSGAGVPEGEGAVPVLAGRDAHIAVIGAALAEIRSTGASVLLRGDPGMGKTALLEVAEAAARRAGLRVLRMTGAEAESGLPFAALHQVLWPLLDDAQVALTEDQRAALERALGLREGKPPEGFTVAGAALTLLAHAAARRPLVLLLDDLQWADPSSTAVFGYVRLHLAPLPVVIIAATRFTGAVSRRDPDDTEGLPGRLLDLEPLDERQAELLLGALHPRLPDGAHHRVLRAAGGNPLALHEFSAQVREAALDGPAHLEGPPPTPFADPFDELPLSERLGRLYEDRLRALPAPVRHLLLVASLGGSFAQRVTVLRELADRDPDTSWAEFQDRTAAAGLAYTDPASGHLSFHHPLVRAGVAHIAAPAERRAAHRLLADALPDSSSQRIVHLAAAAIGTDSELAVLVQDEADRMAAQGADAEAARMMARAAGISPDPVSRTARFVTAAMMAVRGGRLRLAAELVAQAETEARPGQPEPAAVYAFVVACTRLQLDGDPMPAIELLPQALDLLSSPAAVEQRAALLDRVLFLLLVVAVCTGNEQAWAVTEHPLADTSELAVLCRRAWAGPSDTADDVPLRLREAVAALPEDQETAAAWLLLWTAAAVDAVGEQRELWSRFARRHAYATQAFLDVVRAHDDFLHGRWDASLAASRQGAEIAAGCGHRFTEMLFLQNVAEVLAARGDRAGLAELEPVLGTAARERHMRPLAERLTGLKVLTALADGRAEDAWQHARVLTPSGAVPPRTPWFHLSLVDWVQAAVDSGRRAEVPCHLKAVRAAGIDRVSSHHAFLVAVAEAIATDDEDEREERYAVVYAHPGAGTWPFPLARAHLAHGVALRRQGRGDAATGHLEAALTAFTRLGATPWADRASREVAALTEAPAHPVLSAQELRIAELAAEGLTNRQIGDRLGLSPRTVGAHLYKIFPKLGITTRAGVALALAEPPEPGPERPGR